MKEVEKSENININYLYFLHYLRRFPGYRNFKVLDFGCGSGEVVTLLRDSGIDCLGVDLFVEGEGKDLPIYRNPLFKEGIITTLKGLDGLPFADKTFDLIISNMVFEHVEDLEGVIKELGRVLKDNGVMCHHFPSRESIREGHTGIHFLHWFPVKSRSRYIFAYILRSIGVGYYKYTDPTVKQWVDRMVNYVNNFCYYRSRKELRSLLNDDFQVRGREIDYISFRWSNVWWVSGLLRLRFAWSVYRRIFRRIKFTALELRRRAG